MSCAAADDDRLRRDQPGGPRRFARRAASPRSRRQKTIAREYVALNPARADRRPGSFKVNLRTGRWADVATGDRGGDPVSLCAYVEGVSQAEAARRLARMLGLDTREGRRHGSS